MRTAPHVWLPAIRTRSGTEVYTRRLAAALQRAGAPATVSWLPYWREWWPPVGLPAPAGATLIHCNSWTAHAFADRGLPLVVTQHGSCVRDPDWTRDASFLQRAYYRFGVARWEARSIAAAAAVVAVSHAVERSIRECHGPRPVHVIHNWVDTQGFRPSGADREPGPFRLLFVGNLTRRKGADLLPDIARALGPGFELRFVGSRQPRPRAALPRNMVYTAPVQREEEMAALYRQCDVLLATSRSEGFGYAALEAMACGRPVVATRTGALPEVVSDGVTGFLCAPGDVRAFVSACRRLSDDRALLRTMGEAARTLAVERFSEATAVAAYLRLYASVGAAT